MWSNNHPVHHSQYLGKYLGTGSTQHCTLKSHMMYKAMVLEVFLYRCEIWVVTVSMMTVIKGFHHWVARKIAGKTARYPWDGGWEWPPVEEDLDVAGIYLIKGYIQRRQATIAAPISNHPIYELFAGA